MKLVIAIVNNDDSRILLDRLTRAGFSATVTTSTGAYTHLSSATIFCGVEDSDVEDVLSIARESASRHGRRRKARHRRRR